MAVTAGSHVRVAAEPSITAPLAPVVADRAKRSFRSQE
jgi:hypothetical protein